MKRGTESIVRLGKGVEPADFSGINVLSTVILGKKESATKDFNGLFITDAVLLGKKISHSAVVTATVHGVSPLSLPSAVANSLSYVKAFGGTEIKPEEYIDSVTALGKTEQRNLPKGYVELEYIEASNESQYITTNILPDWTTEIDAKFRTGNNKTFTVLSRWTNSPAADTFGVIVSSTSSNIVSYFGRYSDGLYQNDVNLRLNANQDVEYKLGESSVQINTRTYSITRQNLGFEDTLPLWIFKGNFLGEANAVDPTGSRVYSLKIKTQGVLVFNGIPAKNASGVVGLYDKVSGQFLTNQGTGELIAGPAVTIPEEYTELEYIESTGTQYIDTGIIPNTTTRVVTKIAFPDIVDTVLCWGSRSSGTYLSSLDQFYCGRINAVLWYYSATTQTVIHTDIRPNVFYDIDVTNTRVTATATQSIYLFALNNLGTATTDSSSKIAKFEIYNNGVMVRNLVPVKRNSDNVLGMYDLVSGQFFTNQGTGSFVAGPAIIPTPTPDKPIDIWCNNGVLKVSPNEANYIAKNVVLGYWLRNSDGQPEASPANFYTNMMPIKPNVSYVCFGRNKETNTISGYNRIAWYDANGVWIRNSTYTQNQPGIDVAPTNAAFARFHCNINGTDVTQEVIDSYNWVFQQGIAEVSYKPTGIYTNGAVETITDALGNTATAEMLLNANTYADEQEIISGQVTRNLDIKVFNGTENWTQLTNNRGFFYGYADDDICRVGVPLQSQQMYCTHFNFVIWSDNSRPMATNSIGYNIDSTTQSSNGNITIRPDMTAYDTLAKWKAFLAEQYANGTPVIVVRIANQATESVAGQTLKKAPLTVTGSLEDLTVRATSTEHTVPTPDIPLEINSNNGVLKAYTNLVDNDIPGANIDVSGTIVTVSPVFTTHTAPVVPGKTYACDSLATLAYYTSKPVLGSVSYNSNRIVTQETTFTVPNDPSIKYVAFRNATATAVLVEGNTVSNLNKVYTDGTVETIKDSLNNTATAEMLLKVGDYQDVQSIIDGVVTRNIGIKVLDGTESWTAYNGGVYFPLGGGSSLPETTVAYCTHFGYAGAGVLIVDLPMNEFTIAINGNCSFKSNDTATKADWVAWLKSQYDAGTPVIIVYPLATETTESVTGQTLQVQAGDNTLEITQASLSNLELEAEYQKSA
jgi:hypothetical protein